MILGLGTILVCTKLSSTSKIMPFEPENRRATFLSLDQDVTPALTSSPRTCLRRAVVSRAFHLGFANPWRAAFARGVPAGTPR